MHIFLFMYSSKKLNIFKPLSVADLDMITILIDKKKNEYLNTKINKIMHIYTYII